MALLSGIGGGNFASSMSNISFFYPKKQQGLALGLNAGLGNFGVTTVQIAVPLFMSYGVFSMFGAGEPMVLEKASGTVIGTIAAGSQTWIQNSGFAWLITLVPLAFLLWFGTNNINTEEVTPKLPAAPISFSIILAMLGIGFLTSVVGLWLMLPENANGSGFGIPKEIVIVLVLFSTVMLLKLLPGAIRTSLDRQYKIFNNKHTWL